MDRLSGNPDRLLTMGITGPLPERMLRLISKAERNTLGKSALTVEELLLKDRVKNEKQLQANIVNLLSLHKIVAIRQRMDKKSNVVIGCPDILAAIQGVPIAFEAKMPGQNPTAEQLQAHHRMQENGWRVFVVHDLVEVRNILATIENHHPN